MGLEQIVKEPMDLKTMRHKVSTGQYKTLQEMRDDCELMSKNALLFNRAPGEVSAVDGVVLYDEGDGWKGCCGTCSCVVF